jgi:ABC-2 type transport system ATP-binding protein
MPAGLLGNAEKGEEVEKRAELDKKALKASIEEKDEEREADEDRALRKKKKKVEEGQIAIRLTKVSKAFGLKVAVDDVTLQIEAGSVYGLIGPNGAGKTTTFSMLAGYLKPTSGKVEVLGYAPDQVEALRSRIGVLPQDALLPAADRVGEFLIDMARLQGMPARKAAGVARDALAEVDGRAWWNVKCGALSHGMAKRVQLAQALLGDPDLVLLDEPTAGLDPRIAYEVRQLIKSRKGRCTLVVSSHNLQELEEVCDAAAILDRGHLVGSGSMGELTAATQEVRFKVPALVTKPGHPPGPGWTAPKPEAILDRGPEDAPAQAAAVKQGNPTPLALVRGLPMVKLAEYDDERGELIVHFDSRGEADAEQVIEAVLWVLLQQRIRISGVSKGRGLEQRVMEMTD